jgi:membrane-associated protease RseP (regulator of RpoE activity)
MAVLWGILIGLCLYTIAAMWLDRHGALPEYLGVQGPILTLHTQRGKDFLDWLAGPKRFWRAWANAGVGIALVVMTGMFAFLAYNAVIVARNPPPVTAVNQPKNVLVIPGVNDFLPLSVAPEIVAGLAIGLIVHEGGHGLLCRVEDIDIDSMGLAFLAIVPVGAFVEPDEESRKQADRGGQTRMFAAGVTNNFAISAVMLLLLFGPVIGSIAPATGAGVAGAYDESAAAQAGIDRGDRIVAVDGASVADAGDLETTLADADRMTSVTLADGTELNVERSLLVVESVAGNPLNLSIGETVLAVNDTAVHTETELRSALAERSVATIETDDGSTTGPVGVYATRVEPEEPLANATGIAGSDATVVLTRVAGQRTVSTDDLQEALEGTAGQTVAVELYVDGQRRTADVTLGEQPGGDGYVGVRIARGTAGVRVTDFGVRPYPTRAYLQLMGGDVDSEGPLTDMLTPFEPLLKSVLGLTVVLLFLPVASIYGFPENFPGFVGPVENFYTVGGPLEPLGGGVFLLANLLYWSAWINIQLGFFNCIPAFPLDGGHILRTSTETVLSRLPFEMHREHVRVVTVGVGLTMLFSLLVMLFGPHVIQ